MLFLSTQFNQSTLHPARDFFMVKVSHKKKAAAPTEVNYSEDNSGGSKSLKRTRDG